MRSSHLILLSAVTSLAVIGAAISLGTNVGPSLPERNGEAVYPGLKDALPSISQVRLKTPLIDFTFESDGALWRVKERDGFPADMQKLAETVFALSDLTYVEPKTANPERYARLQIEDPFAEGAASRGIQIMGSNGDVLVDLIAGRRKFDLSSGTATRGLYIRKPGDDRGWLAAGTLSLSDDAETWLDEVLLTIDPMRMRRAVLVHRDGERVEIVRGAASDPYRAITIPKGSTPKKESSRANIATVLENFTLHDVARLSDLSFVGGENVDTLFETFDGLTVSARLLRAASDGDEAQYWAMISARADDDSPDAVKAEAAALNAKAEGWIFRIPTWKSAQMVKRNIDLIETGE